MRKIMVLFMLIALVSAGCSNNNSKKTPDTTQLDNKNQSGVQADEFYNISWLPLSRPVDKDGAIVKYMEEKFNVELDIWNDDQDAVQVRIATGEIPDRMEVFVNDFNRFVEQDVLAEIPIEMLQEHAPNLYRQYMEDFKEGVLNYPSVDGKLYGLPNGNPESGGARRAIGWRGDWLENVGIAEVPDTLAEMEEAMYKFTNNDPDKNGKNDTFGLSYSMLDAVYGAFGYLPEQWHKKDGQLVYGGIQPEMKDALAVLRKWYADKVIAPEFVAGNESIGGTPQISIPFTQGLIGVSAHDTFLQWKIGRYAGDREGENIRELRNNNPQATVVYGTPPVGPDGHRGMNMEPQLHTRFLSFGKQVEDDPGKMIRILEMTDYASATMDGFLQTRFGFEGTHWNWQEQGGVKIPVPIEPYNDWSQITSVGGGIAFAGIWLPEIIGKVNAEYMWRMEEQPGLNEHGYINEAALIFTESRIKYQDELLNLQSNVYREIITGARSLDAFDNYVKEWNKLGGAELTKDINEVYAQMNK